MATTVERSQDTFVRSYEQRLKALERANDVRSKRAKLKRQAKRREVDLLEVLADPPADVESMKALDLLVAMPKVGRVKANKALVSAKASPSKTVGGLSPRQRGELLAFFGRQDERRLPSRRVYGACRRCDARLLVPTVEGVCGFCRVGITA